MESEKQSAERETPPQTGSSWKLIIDPALTNGLYKVCRFDGQHFNLPVEDLGLFPVDAVRDPRICRLWSKYRKTDLSVPKFKVDEWFVGPVPPKEVTFSKLNDNVKETFLTNMCNKYGNVDEVEIFYNPKKKHLGIAKVVFDTVKAAKDAVQHLHQTSVMGNIIHVEIDPKGENRARYLQLLINGLFTPWTLPVGSSNQALQRLIDSFVGSAATQQLSLACSPTSVATPLSLDTAYSSIWQDTPCSFGLTPRSQGTPRTPCLTATPLSQDSCYSSLQATPVLQGEPSTFSVHKPPRQELWHRKAARQHRGSRAVSNINLILKHCHQQTPQLFSDRKQANSQQLALWNNDPQSPACDSQKTPFIPASPVEESCSASSGLPESCSSFETLSINVTQDQYTRGAPPPDGYRTVESLDSRIESLLTNSQIGNKSFFDGETLDGDALSQDSPVSSFSASESQFCTEASRGPFTRSHHTEAVDASPLLDENGEDETIQAVSFLTRNLECPSPQDSSDSATKAYEINKTEAQRLQSQSSTENHSGNKEEELSDDRQSAAPQPSSGSFFSSTAQHFTPKAPPAVSPGCPRPSATTFPLPIPPFLPSVPPVPLCLPNGAILIPPPGWVPPPGRHSGIAIPPPPIPPSPSVAPPPAFLRPPPHLSGTPSVPPPVLAYPSSLQPAGPLDKVTPQLQSSAASSFPRPPWPAAPLPRFNPFMPPPDYVPAQENPHKITVEKVLEVLMDELKSIIRKDITRRMIEGVAFKAFESWWDCQEKKAKVETLKSGAALAKERSKLLNPLSRIGEPFKKPPLPSFKVKRKRSEDFENQSLSCDKTSDSKLGAEIIKPASEIAKRRHARPLELDSDDEDDDDDDDDDDEEKEEKTLQDEENRSDIKALEHPDRIKDQDDDDCDGAEEERELSQRQMEDETVQSLDGEQHSVSETSSGSSSSEESEYSSDFDSSGSFSSDTFEDSSSYLSTEDEGVEEEDESSRRGGCFVISLDEDAMELEDPLTPSAPLTPDPGLQDWSELLQGEETEGNHYTSRHQHTCDLDNLMELQTSEAQELQPPSPLGLTGVELCHDVEMESPDWSVEFQESVEDVRPLTPTGCLLDSDPEVLIKTKSTSPAVEEVERPQTPGKGIPDSLDSEESYEANHGLSPGRSQSVFPPTDLLSVLCPSYQERPRTPGREDRCAWTHYSGCGRVPSTPGRDIVTSDGSPVCPHLSSPPPSSNPYRTAPKTPGRDIKLPRRAFVHNRKRHTANSLLPWMCNRFHRDSPLTVSSPSSLSDTSSDLADGHDGRMNSGVRSKPLQGLENMPGMLNEKNYLRRKHWTRLKRRRRAHHRHRSLKRATDSACSGSRPHRWRSMWQEKRILHRIWREGLDEEDERLLQCVYERLQERNNGPGWLNDTLWIPHPLTKVFTETSEDQAHWQPKHRSGSARSEGYYKISKSDKMRYLNHTRSPSELPSTSTQGSSILAQQSTSLRAGSDFRSEQRRLLSTFSCDSDLVKFNQLKFRKKRIRFSRSHIHEWGLFAMEPIAADEMVIEYVGQIIRQVTADTREQRYEEEGIGNSYMFRVDEDTIIDATKLGNLARFINHSCNPNCYAKIITVEAQKKIVIYSRQPININEEITYDYKFPIEDIKIPCLCGEDSCRGFLN